MKKRKRILSVLFAVAVVSSLFTACGGPEDKEPANSSDSSSQPAREESGAEDESQPDAGSGQSMGLPDVELKNKKIVVYHITDSLDDWRGTLDRPGVVDIMEKEYGAEFEVVSFADWGKQYEKLATLKMSNDIPDLLMQCDFPVAIANGLCQPTENYIDYSHPRWDGMRNALEANKWNGHYYVCNTAPFSSADWTYFNPQFFAANNMKSPLDYYKEGNWDWNAVLEIAQKTTMDTDGDGSIDQWGLGMSNPMDIHTQTGVPLVEMLEDGSVKLNLRDPKIEEAANFYSSLGPKGYNVLNRTDEMTNAKAILEGRLAIGVIGWWVGVQEGISQGFAEGTLDFVPLPKWPGEETNYIASQMQGLGIGAGCQNPEGAALFLEVMAFTNTDAYRQMYTPEVDPEVDEGAKALGMSDEQIQRLYEMRQEEKVMPVTPVRHWIFWSWDDGFDAVLNQPWSQVLESLEPVAQAAVDEWQEKLNAQ